MKNLKKLNKELMNEADKINEKFASLQKKYNFTLPFTFDEITEDEITNFKNQPPSTFN